MKKISFILIFAAILLMAQPGLANSAPLYYDSEGAHVRYDSEGPHYSMGVLKDCKIGVENENLGFDIHFAKGVPSFMDVSTSYEMKNYGEAQSVAMAFPILFTLEDIDALMNAQVRADDLCVNASHLIVSSLSSLAMMYTPENGIEEYAKNMRIEDLLTYCNDPVRYKPSTYSPDDMLDIYALQGNTKANYIELMMGYQGDCTFITFGASKSYVLMNKECHLVQAYLDEPQQETYIAVSSGFNMSNVQIEAFELVDNYYHRGERTPLPNDGIQLTRTKSMTTEQFIRDVCLLDVEERYPAIFDICGEDELYSQLAAMFDYSYITTVRGVSYAICDLKMAGLLVYEIPFEAGQTRIVEVTYQQRPDYFGSSVMHAKYSYITSPAQHYRDFGTLNVEVRFINKPLLMDGYVYSDILDFTKLGRSQYAASMQGLPTEQLTFSVVSETPVVEYIVYTILWLLRIAIVGGISVLIVFIITKRNMKRMRAERQRRGN